MKKISICTVCMNRLRYLSRTLPVNIAENRDYEDLEFVVLNYNSKDDMDDWMRTHMREHIASGLVKYYKTTEPEYFSLAHSKNMCTKLATGAIICNMDADNYAGPGYVNWVHDHFMTQGPDIVITTVRKDAIPHRDQGGKLCFTRDLFMAIKGYDESLFGYGMDDIDLCNRLENAGTKRVFIEAGEYLRFIPHSDQERIANHRYPNNLKSIYQCISNTGNDEEKFLYLFVDNSFAELTYRFNESEKSNLVITFVGWTVGHNDHRKGTFCHLEDRLILTFADDSSVTWNRQDGSLFRANDSSKSLWKKLGPEDRIYFLVVMAYNECLNRLKYVDNDQFPTPINENGWGLGDVRQIFF